MADNSVRSHSSTVSQISSPKTRANSSTFSDIAVRKLDSALFSYTSKVNQVTNAVTNPVREFIRPYHQNGSAYRPYAVADATNLSISLCSLYYTLKHAYQQSNKFFDTGEFQSATNEMHAAESTPEGLTWIVLFTVFLVGFSTLGSFYDENKDKPWVKNLVFLWPYARDAGKQFKWWSKGWWALSGLLIHYKVAQQNYLIQLIFPLAIIGGIFSAINRIWLRWMRDQRKDMVKNNLDLIEGIKTSLHHLDKMPKSLIGYERSLILLTEITQESEEVRSLFYVNADGEKQHIIMQEHEWDAFCQQIEELQTENIHARMKQYLSYIRKNLSDKDLEVQTNTTLHFLDEKDLEKVCINGNKLSISDSMYFDSYIYFSQAGDNIDNEKRLFYVTKEGRLIERGENSQLFYNRYQEIQQNKNVLNLADIQLQSILQPKINNTAKELGQTYGQFVNLRQKILGTEEQNSSKIQNQHWLVKLFAPLSAGLSGVGDGLYFYMFVARMIIPTLTPHLALLMLGTSSVLFVICILTRVAEELDFERRLDVTILRTEAELSKKDCKFLHDQLEKLLDAKDPDALESSEEIQAIATALESSRENRRKQLIRHNVKLDTTEIIQADLSLRKKTIVLLWNELRDELMLSNTLQEELKPKIVRSYWAAALEGLQNGLAIQGAIASFSFMVSTLCYVSAAACPPVFVLGCLVVGIAALVVSCIQGLISYRLYLNKINATEAELALRFRGEELKKMTNESGILGDIDTLRESINYISGQSLEPNTDFIVVEWSEIIRLLCKGAVKGRNAGIEYFARFLESIDNKWMLPYIIAAGIGSFAVALGMRATAKGFAVGRPDNVSNPGTMEKNNTRKFFDKNSEKNKTFNSETEQAMKKRHYLRQADSCSEIADADGERFTPPPMPLTFY
ncbi:MAG: hypothetical protein ACO1N3_00595 [Gammaproteobacteria bacterium]